MNNFIKANLYECWMEKKLKKKSIEYLIDGKNDVHNRTHYVHLFHIYKAKDGPIFSQICKPFFLRHIACVFYKGKSDFILMRKPHNSKKKINWKYLFE